MGKLNVKNGTPVGNAHLCKRCEWGQFITGYRESDLLVICTHTTPISQCRSLSSIAVNSATSTSRPGNR